MEDERERGGYEKMKRWRREKAKGPYYMKKETEERESRESESFICLLLLSFSLSLSLL